MKKRWTFLLASLLALPTVSAAEELTGFFQVDVGVLLLQIAGAIIVLSSFAIIPLKDQMTDQGKKIIFTLLIIVTMASSLYFAGAIVYENVVSDTGGPIHWHADYQVWACGERLNLNDPQFPSNKIGSPLFHEHDDDRIHIEGTVLRMSNIDLGSYFEIIGGELRDGRLVYPSTSGQVEVEDGDMCNGQPGTLDVYVNGERIEDYEDHLIYPHAYVPPGDCIIVEFAPGSPETTDKICSSWEAKGWNYDNYKRNDERIGGETWQ